MIPAVMLAAIGATAWALNRWWSAPCPNCGHLRRACLTCAREADRRMRGEKGGTE
jgi:hypothetical protein